MNFKKFAPFILCVCVCVCVGPCFHIYMDSGGDFLGSALASTMWVPGWPPPHLQSAGITGVHYHARLHMVILNNI